jgi:hypothetical protein
MSQKKNIKSPVDEVIIIPNQPIRTIVPDYEETEHNEEIEEEETQDLSFKSKPVISHRKPRKQRGKNLTPPTDEVFNELTQSICELKELTRRVMVLSKAAQQASKKELRDLHILLKKKNNDGPPRKPRGFALPSLISDEMVDYLLNVAKITTITRKTTDTTIEVPISPGCMLARNELTSALCSHFKSSSMRKNKSDKREIHLDTRTVQLFGIDLKIFKENGGLLSPEGEPIITYFDLQKYLPKHCGKKVKE